MKTIHWHLILSAASVLTTNAATPKLSIKSLPFTAATRQTPSYSIVELGEHHQVWQGVTVQTNKDGKTIYRTNSFTELQTGMNVRQPDGSYVEASEEIEVTKEGAVAQKGRHKVIFSANCNTSIAIDLLTADGKRFQSHVLGLSYFDNASGKSVLIAEVKDSIGQLLPPNQIIYLDAFTDVKADIRYTYTKAGLEQDIILRQQPTPPDKFGLDPKTTRLQVLTEFLDPPAPQKTEQSVPGTEGLVDEALDFGDMKMEQSKAFSLSGATEDQSPITVGKRWTKLDNRDFLVEEVPFGLIEPRLKALPLTAQSGIGTNLFASSALHRVSVQRFLPAPKLAKPSTGTIQLAKVDPIQSPAVVLDYVTLSTTPNKVLQGDSTYYVSGTVNLSGTTKIEGGTVIKYANTSAAKINITGTVLCQTSAYRPAIFTSMDDDSVGEILYAISTGIPLKSLVNVYLQNGGAQPITYKYLRLAYAGKGVKDSAYPSDLWHCQFLNCTTAVYNHGGDIVLRNVLFVQCGTCADTHDNVVGEHLTADGCSRFVSLHNDGGFVTNSLFTAVTSLGDATLYYSQNFSSSSGVYQTAGGGSHYLAPPVPGDGRHAAGTPNINAGLLADLKTKTTYPPIDFPVGMELTGELTLLPQIARYASGPPDLGYHYDVLDYTVAGMFLYGGTVTVLPGTAVGFRNDHIGDDWNLWGFSLSGNAAFVSRRRPDKPNVFASVQLVQEGPFPFPRIEIFSYTGIDYRMMAFEPFFEDYDFDTAAPPLLDLQFSHFYLPAEDYLLWSGSSDELGIPWTPDSSMNWNLRDCNLQGGHILVGYPAEGWDYWFTPPATLDWKNNLFDRMNIVVDPNYYYTDADGELNLDFQLAARNNLFRGCRLVSNAPATSTGELWQFTDNLFDKTAFEYWANSPPPITHDYNGYWKRLATELVAWQTDRLAANNTDGTTDALNDQVLATAPAYQTSTFGDYYLATSSPLYDTSKRGSRSVADAGLYHYTTRTDQTKDGAQTGNIIIGRHYVAAGNSTSSQPKDTDDDSIADYLEDWNGNGQLDLGEGNPAGPQMDLLAITGISGTSGNVSVYVSAKESEKISALSLKANGVPVGSLSSSPWPLRFEICHRADQNQPLVGTSKPASLRQEIHNSFLVWFKGCLIAS